MQQAATAPATAVIATPAPSAQPTVVYVDAAGQLKGIPTSAQEVQGLRQRKEILEDQLEEVVDRREELTQSLRNGIPEGQARTGVEQRIQLLDQRILQIENDQAMTDRLLSNTPPHLLAETIEEPEFDTSGYVDEDEAAGIAFFTFGVGVVLSMIVGRIRRRRWKQKTGANAIATAMANDPRIDKLTQAVDAIAEEVERIGEGQRFVTNLLADRREPVTVGRVEGQR